MNILHRTRTLARLDEFLVVLFNEAYSAFFEDISEELGSIGGQSGIIDQLIRNIHLEVIIINKLTNQSITIYLFSLRLV